MDTSFVHVGMSVQSLDRSIAFYRDMLGMTVVWLGEFKGDQYSAILGIPGARGRAALLQTGGAQIELFEFAQPIPEKRRQPRSVHEYGFSHFCVRVTDIEAVYSRLKSAGVVFHCAPILFSGKNKATYGRDPDGNVFELNEGQ